MTSPTWKSEDKPVPRKPQGFDWVRVVLRGLALVLVVFGGLIVLLLVRLIEMPIHGLRRPWTPYITVFVCRTAIRILGIRYETKGARMAKHGAVVANHSSWLDIFTLNAAKRIYFVSKEEVANWPGIGWLARATGTVFIRRSRGEARAQTTLFEERLKVGHKLLFFPEGTSTDGLRVLPFKPTLFAAFFADDLRDLLWVQPVTVQYIAPEGAEPRFYGWWGDMDLAPHLLQILAQKKQGAVRLVWHDPVRVSDFDNRKTLSKHCEDEVRSAFESPALVSPSQE